MKQIATLTRCVLCLRWTADAEPVTANGRPAWLCRPCGAWMTEQAAADVVAVAVSEARAR